MKELEDGQKEAEGKPTMIRGTAILLALAVVALPAVGDAAQAPERLPVPDAELVGRYCLSCHNDRRQVAELSLEGHDPARAAEEPVLWERVVRKLHARAMPPQGMPRPAPEALDAFVAAVEARIDAAAVPHQVRPKGPHRLNRTEYVNAVRDLLGIEIDGKALLPADDASFGFDNIASVLKMSPGLMQRYLIVAKKVSRLAVGDPSLRPETATYAYPFLGVPQRDRVSEDLPFGSRGGMAVRHYFPVDGIYETRARLERTQLSGGSIIRGKADPNELYLYIDGESIATFPMGAALAEAQLEAEKAAKLARRNVSAVTEDRGDDHLVVRVPVKAGTHTVGAAFQRSVWYVESYGFSPLPWFSDVFSGAKESGPAAGKVEVTLRSLEITGPFEAVATPTGPVQSRLFVCRPEQSDSEAACARTILARLARRAYRRPLNARDVQALLEVYEQRQAEADFETGIRRGIECILTAPDFLFRLEREGDNAADADARLSDLDLASRLSFFLWSSIPDEELLSLAESGRLNDPRILERQVRRMLADPKSKGFLDNFFGQWLYLRNIPSVKPNTIVFPEFNEDLRNAFRRETELFLESQLREDRSALELLTAEYTFVNETLAKHYDIPNVYGSHFRRVAYPDERRAGLLGHASLLMVTSYPNRTSPVLRGKWLLENILGTPPPPPPPVVPPFPEQAGNATDAPSVRERLEQHRRNPVCAACHATIDPPGFALENFDALGQWRDMDGRSVVDASGVFADGTQFDGPASFRAALLDRRYSFLTTLTQKLLTYAVGRGVTYADMPVVRQILRESKAKSYQWSSLITAVVRSPAFQM